MQTKLLFKLSIIAMVFFAFPAFAGVIIPGPHELPDPDTTPPDSTKPVEDDILYNSTDALIIK